MIDRLWNAIKARPTRSLWIGAVVLLIGGIGHFAATYKMFFEYIDARMSSPSAVAEAVATAMPFANAALLFEGACILVGITLGLVATLRTVRSQR